MGRPGRYAVLVGDTEYRVEIGETGVMVDEEPVSFELASLNDNGQHLLRRDGRSTEVYLKTSDYADYDIMVRGHHVAARVDRANRRRTRAVREVCDAGEVRAPMPGLVVEVLVSEGDTVEMGQSLLTEEAMKMQMELRASCRGRVAEVCVDAGAQVDKEALVVRIVCCDD